LDFIDWSHSLLMSIVWSFFFAAFFWKRGGLAAAVCGFAVFSHFLLDLLMHPGDLALWPHSEVHVGFGIWTRWPDGWWFFELAFIVLCWGYYVVRARRLRPFGGRAWIAAAVVLLLHISNPPLLSPTK